MVPVVALVVLTTPRDWGAATAVFALASISDALDGRIARARGCISRFGTIMDPLADKLLIAAALLSLTAIGRASVWLTALIIAREVAVSVLRVVARRRGVEIAASRLGKAKMGLQVLTVIALMAGGAGAGWVQVLIWLTATVTVASGIDYALGYRRSLHLSRVPARTVPAIPPTAARGAVLRGR
jgi:CDP-diacylglycerol--glycerol-3-phosphate 3-phosphatidyltransferase